MKRSLIVLLALLVPSFEKTNRLFSQEDKTYRDTVSPFLTRHCKECHSGEKAKGHFKLEELDPRASTGPSEERWQSVLKQLQSGEMPPKKKPRPPEQEVRAVVEWITAGAAARRSAQGRVVLRRLNRIEYENTVHDLLGVDVDLREALAVDGSMDGFDNVATALHLSSYALMRYLEAADKALVAAIANRAAPPQTKKKLSLKDAHPVKSSKDAYRVTDEGVACFTSVNWHRVHLPWSPQVRGLYRYRITASAIQSGGKPVTFDLRSRLSGLQGYYDVPPGAPTVIEFVLRNEPNGQTDISILPYGLSSPQSVTAAGGPAQFQGPGLLLHDAEVEGPLNESWPPPSHKRIFGELPQASTKGVLEVVSTNPATDAGAILRSFVRRAFRRAVSDADLKPFLALFKARMEDKDSFEQAIRAALSHVMMSREFLFLSEKPGVLDDFALASRLSYFFWSSMPDDELLDLAEQKKLGKSETLRAQVDRLLRSPKAAAFTRNFCGQWLGLRDIDFTAPDHLVYPEFDEMLKVSMVQEATRFFSEILKDDLPLTNFVSSDFSMLNGRLAKHYGIPGVDGLWEFRKVTLPPGSHRGGVLTMAAILKVTANGTVTSPVLRGAWVLDRILGTPPPKPPPDVPALEPDVRGATTIREQLAKHRADPSCAGCHARIDPPGFALESFDVIGGWREHYRSRGRGKQVVLNGKKMSYLQGQAVDPTGELADGSRFKDIDEFKQLLLKEKDQIARALTRSVTTYATGGAPGPADHAEIEGIVARVRGKNYGFRTLIHEIVQSRMFREK
jgi:hypothetical protein